MNVSGFLVTSFIFYRLYLGETNSYVLYRLLTIVVSYLSCVKSRHFPFLLLEFQFYIFTCASDCYLFLHSVVRFTQFNNATISSFNYYVFARTRGCYFLPCSILSFQFFHFHWDEHGLIWKPNRFVLDYVFHKLTKMKHNPVFFLLCDDQHIITINGIM